MMHRKHVPADEVIDEDGRVRDPSKVMAYALGETRRGKVVVTAHYVLGPADDEGRVWVVALSPPREGEGLTNPNWDIPAEEFIPQDVLLNGRVDYLRANTAWEQRHAPWRGSPSHHLYPELGGGGA